MRLPSTPPQWLILAAVFHVIATIAVLVIGHFHLLPTLFDYNGTGISFAVDGILSRELAMNMGEALRSGRWTDWLAIHSPLHVRLYSISFAVLGRVIGYNALSAEPLNLFYYLATLSLVYLLGREVLSVNAGMLAATIVAVWPSHLLYSTQLIKDPLSTSCLLALLFLMTLLVGCTLGWRHSGMLLVGSVFLISVFWKSRGNMWSIAIAILAVTGLLLTIRMFVLRRFLAINVATFVVIALAAAIIPVSFESTTVEGVRPPIAALALQPHGTELGPWSRLVRQISNRRAAFHRSYQATGSSIDADVSLLTGSDILKYMPRAAEIGFLAPFPNMWLTAGVHVGLTGRIVSGVETSIMYLLYFAAGVCLWNERKRLRVWLIFLTASIGLIGLGIVVANVGALYRLRYAFWIMIIIIAAEGILLIIKRRLGACPAAKLSLEAKS